MPMSDSCSITSTPILIRRSFPPERRLQTKTRSISVRRSISSDMNRAFLTFLLILFIPCLHARETVAVAAAADLVYCMQELSTEFRKTRPDADISVSIGSSGTFFAQIRNGAPFDVFLSADMSFPRRLIAENEADKNSLTPYAIGRIVVWSQRIDLDIRAGIGALTSPEISRI